MFDGFGVVARLVAGCLCVNSVVDIFNFLFVGNVYCGCFDAIAGVFACLVAVLWCLLVVWLLFVGYCLVFACDFGVLVFVYLGCLF